jgi:hypothetical protein
MIEVIAKSFTVKSCMKVGISETTEGNGLKLQMLI